jgi:hypothetical protein
LLLAVLFDLGRFALEGNAALLPLLTCAG